MVTISDVAAEKTKEILNTEGKAAWGLRFYTAGGGCCGPSFGIDIVENPVDGDKVIEKSGTKFFIDKEAMEKLSGMTIDFVDDGQRQGFVVNDPNPPSCGPGCGSSCGS
jgi:iron-sulfur cluster assembly accessory protein